MDFLTRGLSSATVVLMLIGALLLLTPFIQAFAQTSDAVQTPGSTQYSDYGLSALGANDRITLNALRSWTGGNLTVGSFESYIASNLAPYDLRQVLLDIGWQNYTVGTIPQEDWVSNWLAACDVMGIQNVLYVGQLTTDGLGSPWVRSAIAMDPAAQTYSSNGSAVAFISYDSPDVSVFLEKDLATLYSYYGSYPSWIGIGTGSSANDPYSQSGQLFPGLGYSNLSVSSFVNSGYYASDINATGFLPNGQMDPLWAAYRNVRPTIALSSGGGLSFSSFANVYGNGTDSNYIEMRFELKANLSSLSVSWYGSKVGLPGPMVIGIYPDRNGFPDLSEPLSDYAVDASSFTGVLGWQSGPNVSANMPSGDYWVILSSPTSTGTGYYSVYFSNGGEFPAYAQESYVGPGFQHGSTILWLKNQVGQTAALYPYRQAVVQPPPTQEFAAASAFSFNTVFLYLSDRIYDPTNGTLTVADLSDNRTMATGVLSQQLIDGLEGWVPITLNSTITTVPGHTYLVSISEPNGGYSWRVVLRGESTDPSTAGFQGQGSYLLFQLGYVNWLQGQLGFHDMTTNGVDAVTSGYMDAVNFVPSSNETVRSVSILMSNSQQTGNYSTGDLSASIWEGTLTGPNSSPPLSQQVKVPANQVPSNGILNVTGINQPVIAGRNYWIVFSANSNESFTMARFTNAYGFDVLVSLDGGSSWQEPREGPTVFGFVVSLSNQKIGTFVAGKPEVQINEGDYFAEPFYANKTTQVDGVYFAQPPSSCTPSVSIDPNARGGYPSLSPITSGVYNASNPESGGAQFVQFQSVANLQGGQEYWLMVRPIMGTCSLFPLVYVPNAPQISPRIISVVSRDDGLTWNKVSNSPSTLVYQLGSPSVQLQRLGTSDLARYLSSNHSPQLSNGLIRGWTGYVAASEFSMFDEVTRWLNNATGRDYAFYGRGQANVLNQLPARNDVLIPATASSNSCSGLAGELTAGFPIAGVQYYNVAQSSLLSECSGTALGPAFQQLGYMLGTGQDWGTRSKIRVLVVGDQVSENVTRYLSVAYNVTYSQIGLDPFLKGGGNLSRNTAVVWTSSENPFASNSGVQLETYVKAGGTLILAQFGGNRSNLHSLTSSIPSANASLPAPGAEFLNALFVHTSYGNLSLNSSPYQTEETSPQVSISVSNYGHGKILLAWFSATDVGQVSDPVVVLSNAISKSAGLSTPFWYDSGSVSSTVGFSVVQETSGPILVWVVNSGEQSMAFTLHLNGAFYGIDSTWKMLNLNDMGVAIGSGSDVAIEGNLASGTWMPVYIVPFSSAALIDYSNVEVNDQYVYPHQSLFKLDTVGPQQVLLLVSSNITAARLLVDDSLSLPSLSSAGDFLNASRGWTYYNSSRTLMVKFVTEGKSTLRLLAYTEPVQAPAALPVRPILALLVALLCVELVVLVIVSYPRSSSTT